MLKKFHRFFCHPLAAFSLLEMAFVLSVMGVVLSYGIPHYISYRRIERLRQTEERIESLFYSLAAYGKMYGTLPFAAMKAPPDLTHQGRSQQGLLCGVVPYKSLNISENEARDGYGRFITYAVAKSATSNTYHYRDTGESIEQHDYTPPSYKRPAGLCGLRAVMATPTPLTIKMPHHQLVETQMGDDFLAIVLISHGPSGVAQQDGHSFKKHNTAGGHVFYDHPLTEGFDDHVRWVTRNNLMARYGKAPCDPDT